MADLSIGGTKNIEMYKYESQKDGFYIIRTKRAKTQNKDHFDILILNFQPMCTPLAALAQFVKYIYTYY